MRSISGTRILLVVFAILFLSVTLALALCKRFELVYYDEIFTLGSGCRLFEMGHFSKTFMLYGLLNTYLIELAGIVGLLGYALEAAKGFQILIALSAAVAVGKTLRTLFPRRGFRLENMAIAVIVLFGSPLLIIEYSTALPATGMIAGLAWTGYLVVSFRWTRGKAAALGLVTAFLLGCRPTSLVFLPAILLALSRKVPSDSSLHLWRTRICWLIVVVSLYLFLAPAHLPRLVVLIIGGILGLVLTLEALARDLRRGLRHHWRILLIWLAVAAVCTMLLFPHYVLHMNELLRQIDSLGPMRFSIGSVAARAGDLAIALLLVSIIMPGPAIALALVFAVLLLASRRYSHRLSVFLYLGFGLILYLAVVLGVTGLNQWYLMPLLSWISVLAGIGIKWILQQDRRLWAIGLLSLLSISLGFQLIALHEMGGCHFARMLRYARNNGVHNLSAEGGAFIPASYSLEDSVSWPLLPAMGRAGAAGHHDCEDARYLAVFGEPPSGWTPIAEFGIKGTEWEDFRIRDSGNGKWGPAWLLAGHPELWRHWAPVVLCRRIGASNR